MHLAAEVSSPVAACSITVERDGQPTTVAMTSPLAGVQAVLDLVGERRLLTDGQRERCERFAAHASGALGLVAGR